MSADLSTSYLGLTLRSPIVASAAPHNDDPAYARRLEDAGVAAIVLPSLFEEEIAAEEIELNRSLEQGTESFGEALDYFPAVNSVVNAGDRYLARLTRVKRAVSVPVIASLNASTPGGWVRYARRMVDAGADALELNVYHVVADPATTAATVEAADIGLVSSVADALSIPLSVKLSPFYTAFGAFARRVAGTRARGLVLFNRFYQPDLDLDSLDVVPRVDLSRPADLRLPLRWIALLRPVLGPEVSLAASSGIASGADVVKALAVGADVAMLTSALLRSGPEHVATVEAELRAWLDEREYVSADELRGSASGATAADPAAFERANYMRSLRSWATPSALESGAPRGASTSVAERP